MTYIKHLDSIRAIAVLLVIITHWFPEDNKLNIYTGVFNGVDIFFTLSGFLITRILLENRIKAEQQGTNMTHVVKSFFVRRFLRIFPIYYLTIFLLFILGPITDTGIRTNFLYFLTYTSNIYFFKHGWDGILSHLWSLSVEEQFYLLWPWLMLFINKQYLLPLILTFILVGVVGQFYFGDILTFCCFDGLGLGALLAWLLVLKPVFLKKLFPILLILAIISCSLQVIRVVSRGSIIVFPSRTLTSFFTIWLITAIILNEEKKSLFFNSILSNQTLLFIGKISYGIYLYHLILPYFTSWTFLRINKYLPGRIYQYNFYLICIENFCLLMIIAYLSWKLIEQPILKLKEHFEYQKAPVVQSIKVYS